MTILNRLRQEIPTDGADTLDLLCRRVTEEPLRTDIQFNAFGLELDYEKQTCLLYSTVDHFEEVSATLAELYRALIRLQVEGKEE